MFFLALCLIVLSPLRLMAEVVPATDSRVTFVGRALESNGALTFDFPAIYFRVAFTGKSLSMRVSDNKRDFYAVWLDTPTSAEPTRIVEVKGNDTIIELILPADVKKSKVKEHQVVVQKRTEAGCGKTTVHEFITDGRFVQAPAFKERQIEFIGDSYTCGYGVDAHSRKDPFTDETENASRTYASIVSRYFDADYMAIAHSGRGICRNAGSNIPWDIRTCIATDTTPRVRNSHIISIEIARNDTCIGARSILSLIGERVFSTMSIYSITTSIAIANELNLTLLESWRLNKTTIGNELVHGRFATTRFCTFLNNYLMLFYFRLFHIGRKNQFDNRIVALNLYDACRFSTRRGIQPYSIEVALVIRHTHR